MTEARLEELQRMRVCLQGLMDVRLALNDNRAVVITARGSQVQLHVGTYHAFEEEFDKFISTQLCRLQQAFDEA
jgi:hypothetical protein